MRAVVQRVSSASVLVEGAEVGAIGAGLLVLLGIEATDGPEDIAWLAGRITTLRLFAGAEGPWAQSVIERGGGVLLVSQFTLHASVKKGTKASWHRAAKPEVAEPRYEEMAQALEALLGRPVARGKFGAMMQVRLVNDGPVTLILDSRARDF